MIDQSDLHYVWGVLIAFGGSIWRMMNGRVKAIEDTQKTLFDKLDGHARRSEDRHIELLTALHNGLAGKQDKNHDSR